MQPSLFGALCRSCFGDAEIGALCRRCYARSYHSRRCFGGHREAVLGRDRRQCRACGSRQRIIVHHRRPGVHHPAWLITLCAGCHAQVHRSSALRTWVPDGVEQLWEEMHPKAPLQMRMQLFRSQGTHRIETRRTPDRMPGGRHGNGEQYQPGGEFNAWIAGPHLEDKTVNQPCE